MDCCEPPVGRGSPQSRQEAADLKARLDSMLQEAEEIQLDLDKMRNSLEEGREDVKHLKKRSMELRERSMSPARSRSVRSTSPQIRHIYYIVAHPKWNVPGVNRDWRV